MNNQIKILLGIIIAGIVVSIFIGFNSTGFAVQDENLFTRNLPSSVKAGDIFYVKYLPVSGDVSYDVQIRDSVSGGCEFLYSGEDFERLIVYIPENMEKGIFKVKAPDSAGSCKFEGVYQILNNDERPVKRFFDKTVVVE